MRIALGIYASGSSVEVGRSRSVGVESTQRCGSGWEARRMCLWGRSSQCNGECGCVLLSTLRKRLIRVTRSAEWETHTSEPCESQESACCSNLLAYRSSVSLEGVVASGLSWRYKRVYQHHLRSYPLHLLCLWVHIAGTEFRDQLAYDHLRWQDFKDHQKYDRGLEGFPLR